MGKLPSFRNTFRRTTTDDTINQVATAPAEENKTDPATVESGPASKEAGDLQEELPGEDLQRGVQDVEAVTLSWSKASLIAVFAKYVLSHLVCFVSYCYCNANSVQQHLVAVLCQCIPIIDSPEFDSLRDE